MKQRDRVMWGLLLLAFVMRPRKGSGATTHTLPSGATIPIDPGFEPYLLQPGAYWYCCSAAEAPLLIQWFNDRTLLVDETKLLGSNGVDCAIVLFKINAPLYWHLSGLPQLAPNGMATTLEQLGKEPSLADFFLRKAQQGLEAVRRLDAQIQKWLDGVFR